MTDMKFEDLLGTGAHFGHVTRKWHPNYKPYILMEKNGVHIINLQETVNAMNKVSNFIKDVVTKNGEILFVGTKKQARDIVQEQADRCRMFYIGERWVGGEATGDAGAAVTVCGGGVDGIEGLGFTGVQR